MGEGDARYSAKREAVEWRVELVDGSNPQGSLEFEATDADADAFFPIQVFFSCTGGTIAGVKIGGVADVRSGKAVSYVVNSSLEVDEYVIQ